MNRTKNRWVGVVAGWLAVGAAALGADRLEVVDRPDAAEKNDHFAANRPPLHPTPLVDLPFGAVKPQGWLRKQLRLQADGYVGHLPEISAFCNKKDNAWLSPLGQGKASWEEVPYWLRGYAAMGYVLDDEEIIREVRPWVEAAIASQTEFGYFGPNHNLLAPVHPAIPAECFTTADGRPGLDAEYFADPKFTESKLERVDPQIDVKWGRTPPVDGLKPDHYSVRWSGRITVKETGDYQLSLYCDDDGKVWLDDAKVLEDPGVHPARTTTMVKPVRLEAGKAHALRVEYVQDANAAEIRLGWRKPGAVYEPRGVPDLMPNMNMLYVLRAYHEYTGDERVLDLMRRYFQWELTIPDKLFFSGGWQVPRNGDNIDSVYWLYNRTGEPFLLELAAKLQRCGSAWMKTVTEGHNVDFSQGFRKPALFYQQNGDANFLEATLANWDSIMGIYGQVPGGMFGGDEFARRGYTDPRQAIETCGAVEMILSEQILLRITGDVRWADRLENVAFNTLPACFTADMKGLRYLTSPNQVNSDARSKAPELADGGPMQVMNPHDHHCCQHNGGAGWPYFAQRTWQATPGNGLAAVVYAAGEVTAKVGDGTAVKIAEKTDYPFDGKVEMTVSPAKPVRFPLFLRIPGWARNAGVAVNGKAANVATRPGAFVRIDRTWAAGDTVALSLPMDVTVTTWERNQNSVSVNRGPLTFSLKIAEKYVPYEPKRFKDPWPALEIVPASDWNYALDVNAARPADSLEVVRRPWPADDMPFTHEGTPVEIRARARRLPTWQEDHIGLVDKLQPSPVKATTPRETVTLIPMGAARLRLAAFPVVGDGPDAREWQLPPEPLVSYSRGAGVDPYEAMFDGKVPAKSSDAKTPHFTTYCFGGAEHGKLHWVRRNFDAPTTVDSCEVYWFDETPTNGSVRAPKWWRVLYRDGDEWKPVENAGEYGIELDRFNVVKFKPVTTTALRLEVQCRDGRERHAMGISEWRIGTVKPAP